MFRILLAEGSLNLMKENEFISYQVDIATSKEEILEYSYEKKYDLYIVNFYYYDIIEELKKADDTVRTIFIDEYYDIYHIKKSFTIGDDYLVKPLYFQELAIRVSYQHKKLFNNIKNTIQYKKYFFHINTKQLYHQKQKMKLSPNETTLLEYFLINTQKPLSKDYLLELLSTTDGTLRVYISKLTKLGFNISYERVNHAYTLDV